MIDLASFGPQSDREDEINVLHAEGQGVFRKQVVVTYHDPEADLADIRNWNFFAPTKPEILVSREIDLSLQAEVAAPVDDKLTIEDETSASLRNADADTKVLLAR